MPLKKVALFSTSFVPYSQTFIYDEITNHVDYEVDVFCKSYTNKDLFPFPRVFETGNKFNQLFYLNRAFWPGFDAQFKKQPYDIIHAHFGTGAVYASHYKKKFDIPLITTFWGNDVSALMGSQKTSIHRRRYVKRSSEIFDVSDRILAVSLEMAEILKDLSGRDDIHVWRHGVNLQKFHPKNDYEHDTSKPLKLLLIGRFTQKKGHIYALRALTNLVKNGYNIMLTFIGSGELKHNCEDYVRQNNLEQQVSFSGVLTPAQVSDTIRQSDVVLVPSIVADNHDREGSPTVVKEAGACGLPVIGTYHAGISETIEDGKTGFLIPERHVDALVNRIKLFYDNRSLCEKFGKAARKKMETEFNVIQQVKELEFHYDSILKK
jgi:glycosyltransferase involved in cell wall biosynthesis